MRVVDHFIVWEQRWLVRLLNERMCRFATSVRALKEKQASLARLGRDPQVGEPVGQQVCNFHSATSIGSSANNRPALSMLFMVGKPSRSCTQVQVLFVSYREAPSLHHHHHHHDISKIAQSGTEMSGEMPCADTRFLLSKEEASPRREH